MSEKELYSDLDYKLVKMDGATSTTIFGPQGKSKKFINVAALYSVSTFDHAVETCRILKHLNPNARRVLDATVCVGGNTGPLGDSLEEVVGTELDANNFTLAKWNMLSRKNITLHNESCVDFLMRDTGTAGTSGTNKFDAIIFDPPWNIEGASEISHSTVGIPGVSLRDNIYFFLQFTDYIILKTSRNDDVKYYRQYLKGTLYDVLCLDISNYKLMLIAPKGDKGLDFSGYTLPDLRSFNYKKILAEMP